MGTLTHHGIKKNIQKRDTTTKTMIRSAETCQGSRRIDNAASSGIGRHHPPEPALATATALVQDMVWHHFPINIGTRIFKSVPASWENDAIITLRSLSNQSEQTFLRRAPCHSARRQHHQHHDSLQTPTTSNTVEKNQSHFHKL